jgi:hypothetical protein
MAVLVAQPGADLENCLVPLGVKQVCHEGAHEGLGDRLFKPDRKRHILIREVGKGVGHKKMPRYAQHRFQDPFLKGSFPKFFLCQDWKGSPQDPWHPRPQSSPDPLIISATAASIFC